MNLLLDIKQRLKAQLLNLPELPIQYVDYAVWQRNWLEAGELEKQLTYWRGHLGDEQPVFTITH